MIPRPKNAKQRKRETQLGQRAQHAAVFRFAGAEDRIGGGGLRGAPYIWGLYDFVDRFRTLSLPAGALHMIWSLTRPRTSELRRMPHCRRGDPQLDPFLPQQPNFDHLRKAHVTEKCQHQYWPVHPRQVREAQRRGQRGIRQPHSEGHDG